MARAQNLSENPVHLGLGATALAQPIFTEMDWYEDYAQRTAADVAAEAGALFITAGEGRLHRPR